MNELFFVFSPNFNNSAISIVFEYDDNSAWGKTFSRREIKQNIIETQRWLEDRNMIY